MNTVFRRPFLSEYCQQLRAIQSEIENPLAKALLEGKYAPDSTIHVKEEGGKLVFA